MMKTETQYLITADRQKICFDQYFNNHSKVVIVAHGFLNSRRSPLLKEFGHALLEDYDVIILDFRGHGNSSGFFSWTAHEHLDLTAVLEFAKKQYSNIGLIGFSMGAATSIITASKMNCVDTVIAVSGPSEARKINYQLWKLDFENDILYNLRGGGTGKGVRPGPFWLKKEKPIDLVKNLKVPILFIHGTRDWTISEIHSQELFNATNSPKKKLHIIPHGPHAEYLLRKNKKEFLEAVRQWLRETL